MWRVFSWNVNSLRSAVRKMEDTHLDFLLGSDVIFLQETRMGEARIALLHDRPLTDFDIFTSEFPFKDSVDGIAGKGYSGVAILVRVTNFPDASLIVRQFYGWSMLEMEGRYLEVHFGSVVLMSVYFPTASHGRDDRLGYKQKFSKAFLLRVQELLAEGKQILLGADVNVAQESVDIHPGCLQEITSGFRKEEREWLRQTTGFLVEDSAVYTQTKSRTPHGCTRPDTTIVE